MVCTGSYVLIIMQEIRLGNQNGTSGLKMYKSVQITFLAMFEVTGGSFELPQTE